MKLCCVSLLLLLVCAVLVRADMSFYAIAVGQGDSSIIQCPNRKDIVIIDMGATHPQFIDPSYITYLLKQRFNANASGKNIHILVSHSHVDHYSYIHRAIDAELLPNVRQVILGGNYTNYGTTLRNWLESNIDDVYTINNQKKCFGNANCTLTSSRTGAVAEVKGEDGGLVSDPWQLCTSSTVKFTVLGANIGNTENGQSIVLRMKYNTWSMLMSGDFEMVTPQTELIAQWPASALKSNFYKVAHHGAWTAKKPNLPELLDVIQPQKVYISQGYPSLSKFHHPNSVTVQNLLAVKSIVTIDPSTNAPFVYWDSDKEAPVVNKSGMGRAIYETCRSLNSTSKYQLCQDIWIRTDGHTDETMYMDVPYKYLFKPALP